MGYGADDEARTRYLHLGKVALYQMSYIRRRMYFVLYIKKYVMSMLFLNFFDKILIRVKIKYVKRYKVLKKLKKKQIY